MAYQTDNLMTSHSGRFLFPVIFEWNINLVSIHVNQREDFSLFRAEAEGNGRKGKSEERGRACRIRKTGL